jgi:hypothetical protein
MDHRADRKPERPADPTEPMPTGYPTSDRYDAETAHHDEADTHEPDRDAEGRKSPP